MSATISLNAPVATHQLSPGRRNINATTSLVQLASMIAGLFLALILFNTFAGKTQVSGILAAETVASDERSSTAGVDPLDETAFTAEALSPSMRNALDYVTRRYRVSQKPCCRFLKQRKRLAVSVGLTRC